jgi:tetratricopeptide (TPR) repeat protein
MAPEQAAGQHDRVGPATDVYALGTLLYECLAGRAPFVSPSVLETLRQIREDDPVPPRRWQASIPRDLETICLHCLQKDPQRRYASALELAEDLRRFQQHEPIRIRPTPVWERAAKWCRKRPARATWMALAVLLGVGSVSSAAVLSYRENTRIAGLRRDVAERVRSGREALARDELEVAQARFQDAWQKVQGEPALADHGTSVAGWLDHSRNAINRYHWKQRVPPRDFDSRRDEALLLSVLPCPHLPDSVQAAREAIQAALELAPANFAWQLEREQLVLLDSELVDRASGSEAALALLEGTTEFNSHLFHARREQLLRKLGREGEADRARVQAERHPANPVVVSFHKGMALARDRQFSAALAEFEAVLQREPEHFGSRLLQSVCFLKLSRPAEALVALTACVAQSPRFPACYVLRGQARAALGDEELAEQDFETALAVRPSDAMRMAALIELGLAHWRQHEDRDALRQFTGLTEHCPKSAAGWMLRAAAEFVVGDRAQAQQHFRRAIELHPAWSGADFTRVMTELCEDEHRAASWDLQAAIDRAGGGKALVSPSTSELSGTPIVPGRP